MDVFHNFFSPHFSIWGLPLVGILVDWLDWLISTCWGSLLNWENDAISVFIGAGYLNQKLRINLLKVLDSNGTQFAKIFFADCELNFLHDFTHCPCGISFLTFYFCYCSDLIKRENILDKISRCSSVWPQTHDGIYWNYLQDMFLLILQRLGMDRKINNSEVVGWVHKVGYLNWSSFNAGILKKWETGSNASEGVQLLAR